MFSLGTASPAVLLDLVCRLKIRDVMTSDLLTADSRTSLRDIQTLMRENRVSGIPIVEQERLIGMISVDDIIRALDEGYIGAPAERHMSRKLVVLEDDMPLSFGITYFEKYSFGRFPVLSKTGELVGIVTSRDIMMALLVETNKVLDQWESEVNGRHGLSGAGPLQREFLVRRYDYENAGRASTEIKKILSEQGVDKTILRSVAVASYELEMNIVNHSDGGRMIFLVDADKVVIQAVDTGPGIPDLEAAMTEGYSTANDWIRSLGFGAGMGLPNAKRVSDEFQITSEAGRGTHVTAAVYLKKGAAS